MLELRSHNSFQLHAVTAQRPILTTRGISVANFVKKQQTALAAQAAFTHGCLMSEERACWSHIVMSVAYAELSFRERDARRTLLHMPFTSYRPKIPIEHSLAGEEFLRRWLLVETLAHYEDCGVLVQRLENCARNAIEDEEQLTFDGMFPGFFLPFYTALCSAQAREVDCLSSELLIMTQKCDAQRCAAYLDVIAGEETRLREVLMQVEAEAVVLLRMTMAHMAAVTFAAGKAQRLQEELVRQRKRHNGEMHALRMSKQQETSLLRTAARSAQGCASGDLLACAIPWVPAPPASRVRF
jgi:hypothetical protein